jgi:hypothetical protein
MNKLIAITEETVLNKIYHIRGKKVMLDRDLAEMYGVETRRLNEQVKRNEKRFPVDFMFKLTEQEFADWMSQIATSNKDIVLKMEQLEKRILQQDTKTNKHEEEIQIIFNALKQLLNPPQEARKSIGFEIPEHKDE